MLDLCNIYTYDRYKLVICQVDEIYIQHKAINSSVLLNISLRESIN